MENISIAITSWSTRTRSGTTVKIISMGQIELFDIQAVSKQMTYVDLSC